jgi:hypothetical protein
MPVSMGYFFFFTFPEVLITNAVADQEDARVFSKYRLADSCGRFPTSELVLSLKFSVKRWIWVVERANCQFDIGEDPYACQEMEQEHCVGHILTTAGLLADSCGRDHLELPLYTAAHAC